MLSSGNPQSATGDALARVPSAWILNMRLSLSPQGDGQRPGYAYRGERRFADEEAELALSLK